LLDSGRKQWEKRKTGVNFKPVQVEGRGRRADRGERERELGQGRPTGTSSNNEAMISLSW